MSSGWGHGNGSAGIHAGRIENSVVVKLDIRATRGPAPVCHKDQPQATFLVLPFRS